MDIKIAFVAGLAACATTLAGPSDAFTLSEEPKVAMIIFSPANDGGWSQALDEARVRLEAELGITIDMVDNVADNATALRPVVNLFIERGYNVILGSTFGYSDPLLELAKEHPDVAFLNPAGTTNAENLQSYYARTYQSQYLCGMAAGAASNTGKLGFVAANPIGLVNWTINGYLLGARQVNPDATLNVVFTGSWNDPVAERSAAMALIDQGIDVIGQHVDTPTPQIVAGERGVFATGHHRDMTEFSPATQCSSVWRWDQYLGPELKALFAGDWETNLGGAFLPIGQGVDIECCGDAVPEEVAEMIFAERDALIAGKQIFTGPLVDNRGNEVLADGEVITDGALWGMEWFLEGVTSQ